MDTPSPILHVEDDAAKRSILSHVLRQAGFAVCEATTGQEAMHVAATQHPALIVLEVQLPDMSGFEVCRQLQAHPATAAIPVVYRSKVHLRPEDKLRDLRSGAVGYLAGDDPQELLATIQAVLRMREAEAARWASEARFRDLFDHSLDALLIGTPDGRILAANPAACQLFGYTEAELRQVGRDALHDFSDPRIAAVHAERRRTGQVRGELTLVRKDGSRFPAEVASTIFTDEGGKEQTTIVVRDMTERKQTEAALTQEMQQRHELEARYRLVTDAANDAVYQVDAEGCIVFATPALARLTGYTLEELQGRPSTALYVPEATLTFLKRRGGALRGEPVEPYLETELVRKNGTRVSIELAVTNFVQNGQNIGRVAVARDITSRKRVEAALEEREAQLQAILDHTQAVLCVKDLDGRYRLVNRRWTQLTHWALEAVRGKTDYDVFPVEAAAVFQANDRQAVALGAPYEVEERVLLDGRWRTYFTLKFPLYDPQGKPSAVCGIGLDITEHKAADAERERLLAELQRINEELQQFAHIVSHDLSEPLRTMGNFIQLLGQRLRGQLDAGAQEGMAFVTDAAQRMQQMLAGLLTYTRTGQPLEFQPVDCAVVLAQVLSALQHSLTERGAMITHDPLPTVLGDATRLRQVFQNLLSNALKFCEAPPPRIHIGAVKEEAHWRFPVRDNGIGLDPRQAERIFKVFQRLHTRSEYPGTGMGLAICKKIVEQHGGRIWVESQPGQGAIFFFTLPASASGPQEKQAVDKDGDRA